MRTITSVTICLLAATLFMPQFRHDVVTALGHVGLFNAAASYTEDGGRAVAKSVNGLLEDIMPASANHATPQD